MCVWGGIQSERNILWVWPESDVRKQQLQFVPTDLFLFNEYLNLDFFFASFNDEKKLAHTYNICA